MMLSALTGVGLAACATHPADQPDGTRLQWLAHSLASELAAAGADDPRVIAAGPDLRIIAGYAEGPGPFEAIPVVAPDAVSAASMITIEPIAGTVQPMAVFAAQPIRQAPDQAASVSTPMGLALGRFTDAAMAAVMWREMQGIESAALTGLDGFTRRDDEGVMLLAGPLANAEIAEQRCLALTVWGLSCTPAAWPVYAAPVSGS
jgi:hypothetical protein